MMAMCSSPCVCFTEYHFKTNLTNALIGVWPLTQVYLSSQCTVGNLNPELYRSGQVALSMGVEAGPRMTPECAVIKMMQCLHYPAIPLGVPLAGEM